LKPSKLALSAMEICQKAQDLINSAGSTIKLKCNDLELMASIKHYVIRTSVDFTPRLPSSGQSQSVVVKLFNRDIPDWNTRWGNEVHFHRVLHEIYQMTGIPSVIYSSTGLIISEYIKGSNFFNELMAQSLDVSGCELLARWISRLHRSGLIFGDPRLRNFVITPQQDLFTVDFEDMSENGAVKDDLGEILCSFIDWNPGVFELSFNPYAWEMLSKFLTHYMAEMSHFIHNSSQNAHKMNDDYNWYGLILTSLQKISSRRDRLFSASYWEKIENLIHRGLTL